MRNNYLFVQGKLDTDTDPRLVKKGVYIDMKNAISDNGKVFKPKGHLSVKGIVYTPIAAKIYNRKMIVFANFALQNEFSLFRIDLDGGYSMETILGGITWYKFGTDYNDILDIDIFEDATNDRYYIYWVDDVGFPKFIEANHALNNHSWYTSIESLSVLKAPPQKEPTIQFLYKEGIVNKIEDNIFRFAYRYVYKDGTRSAFSFFSREAFVPNYAGTKTTGHWKSKNNIKNAFNYVEITVSAYSLHSDNNAGLDIDKIEIISNEINSNVNSKIETIICDGIATEYVVEFYNDKAYSIVDENIVQKLYDNVPRTAKVQALIENITIYGDYSEGYDEDITPDWEVNPVVKFQTELTPTKPYPKKDILFASTTIATVQFEDSDTTPFTAKTLYPPVVGGLLFFDIYGVWTTTTALARKYVSYYLHNDSYDTWADVIADTANSRIVEVFAEQGFTISASGGYVLLAVIDTTFEIHGGYAWGTGFDSHASLKRGEQYEYMISYYDKYNRIVSTIDGGHLAVPQYWSYNGMTISFDRSVMAQITISHTPPMGAVKYKISRTENNYVYIPIDFHPPDYVAYNGEIYLKIKDIDLAFIPDEANRLVLVDRYNSGSHAPNLNIAFNQPITRVETVDSTHPTLSEGRYIVIDDPELDGYSIADLTASTPTDDYYQSIFEVYIYDKNKESLYKELPGTFDIVSGEHISSNLHPDDQNQSGATPCILNLFWDNDVVEIFMEQYVFLYKINIGSFYSSLGRPIIAVDNLHEIHRESDITYSNIYVPDSGKNGLSDFNAVNANWKSYDKVFGKVKKIHPKGTDLVIFMENQVIYQPFRKDLLQTISGDSDVVYSNKILGGHKSYAGEWGMSHAKSFARYGNVMYWVDVQRGVVMRWDVNGLYPISYNGKQKDWRDFLKANPNNEYLGMFDPQYEEYLLSDGEQTWAYSKKVEGWSRRMTYVPDIMVGDGVDVYSFSGNDLYKHYAGTVNTYYNNTIVDSMVAFVANKAFSDKKVAHAIYLEGDEWGVEIKDTNNNYTTIDEWENKEGFKYSAVPMLEDLYVDLAVGGIGVPITQIDIGTSFEFTFSVVPSGLAVGDILFSSTADIGEIESVVGNIVQTTKVGSLPGAATLMYKKIAQIEGAPVRDNIFYITLTSEGVEDVELFAVNLEVVPSKV